ncbi:MULTISPECIES: DUF1292 domain-containing protein [Peribacillus]|uniref:Uncharacterized protein n=1 Tax=Peribacillus asahii TaxID=228899 RepID=A0A3Q9RS43_9BACI|nr:DUF1292 domain-containing protein [Peribacillus asahii]HWL22374.1 DUF1292 domain-containing protein [Ureibacillus sp.]AZV44947.1 hypothetical protein BAOM_4367 [Peribacillus asahii]USK59270.1 DUF1292 domain-containing protein [Peribacillus asahii]USK69679.1 DUF1292 domain-containing protein [Peribacillus asahii]USK84574.1 DUF1292 domain-containing protein [Peribacillus asahii]
MDKIEVGDIFTLFDENDEEQDIEVLGTLSVEGNEYVAVGFVEELEQQTEEDVDIFFLRVEEGEELSEIVSDEEFAKVSMAFEGVTSSK